MAGPTLGRGWALVGTMIAGLVCAPLATAGNPFRKKTSVEDLAEKVDKLEKQLQYTGRVVVKSPDVWGQARLTAHREEFEREMARQIDQFTPTLNAEIAIADQAFLSQALSIAGAARGLNGRRLPTEDDGNEPKFTTIDATTLNTLNPSSTNVPGTPPTPPDDRIATGDFTTSVNIVANGPNGLFTATGNNAFSKAGAFQLEPEIILDQRKRFLDHLHQIRRINEGDDSADSPGYSLNLVRVPVSIIPGDHTRENYGAEATFIAEPHITPELLPATFRELVINDVIDQLALPIVKILDLTWSAHLTSEQEEKDWLTEITKGHSPRCSSRWSAAADP